MAELQAFMDESEGAGPDGWFVIAGHIATAEAWANFARQWERMLPHGTLAPNGKKHFKMAEMAATSERLARVPGFYRIIEEHVLLSLSCAVNIGDLRRAQERFWVENFAVDWGFVNNPYKFVLRALMDMFHTNRHLIERVIPLDQRINFIFDDRMDKKEVFASWDGYLAQRPAATKDLYGAHPRFENDQEYSPLQAADFLAWWTRERIEKGLPFTKENWRDFGTFKQHREEWPVLAIDFDEDRLVQALIDLASPSIPAGRNICNLKYPRDKSYARAGLIGVPAIRALAKVSIRFAEEGQNVRDA